MEYVNTDVLDKAILFATEAHRGVSRRGKNYPYIVHPMEAVSIVATITNDQDLMAAAILHDVVEDTEYTVEDIEARFGKHIAELVDAESDLVIAEMREEDSWRIRKQYAIDRLRCATKEVKIVAIGDKLSNMRAIARDYAVLGDKLWLRFHTKERADHEWHYRGLADSLKELQGTEPYEEFTALIEQVFGEK